MYYVMQVSTPSLNKQSTDSLLQIRVDDLCYKECQRTNILVYMTVLHRNVKGCIEML